MLLESTVRFKMLLESAVRTIKCCDKIKYVKVFTITRQRQMPVHSLQHSDRSSPLQSRPLYTIVQGRLSGNSRVIMKKSER